MGGPRRRHDADAVALAGAHVQLCHFRQALWVGVDHPQRAGHRLHDFQLGMQHAGAGAHRNRRVAQEAVGGLPFRHFDLEAVGLGREGDAVAASDREAARGGSGAGGRCRGGRGRRLGRRWRGRCGGRSGRAGHRRWG